MKKIWSYIHEKVLTNHLVQSLVSFFSFRLLETNQANQYLANVMLWFTVSAFILWIFEKVKKIKTPFSKVKKTSKVARNISKLENPDKMIEDFDMTFEESIKFIERGREPMKKFWKIIVANKKTISGILLSALMAVELIFQLSAKLNWDREWYIVAVSSVFVLVEIAILGKGPESIIEFLTRKENYKKLKETKEFEKQQKKAEELKKLLGLSNFGSNVEEQPEERKSENIRIGNR